MGKFSLHLVLMTQWRGRELCGHYTSLSVSRKLQSSLAFKGNYSDEPVICSGVGIKQSSPESSCMKKNLRIQVRKYIGRREVMELKIRMVPASPHRTQGWEPQHQLCPCGFDHFYGHLNLSLERERHPPAPRSQRGSAREVLKCQLWI